MQFPNISPTAFEIYSISVKWYGIAYVIGLIGGLYNFKKIISYTSENVHVRYVDNLLIWVAFGIIVGGRLGYTLFYNPEYYLEYPLQIITGIRKGGMSFHGGLIGTITMCWLFSKHYNINFLTIMDCIACSAPIGIFLGRIANFVNAELWGKTTTLPWGIIFPNAGITPRHPSQIYEAILEGLILFIILNFLVNKSFLTKPGYMSSLFLIFYGFFRIFIEFFREPDVQLGYIFGFISMGMLLSFPMVLLGLIVILKSK